MLGDGRVPEPADGTAAIRLARDAVAALAVVAVISSRRLLDVSLLADDVDHAGEAGTAMTTADG